ncbi:MAG: hypothetical protein EA409_08130 [Saprospirales bacterium]|nr:MAG: hypothetical protein EA409_08130 [Saprospirales bacterium]
MSVKRTKLRGLTGKILDNVSESDLRYAVAQFARQNKDFKNFLHLRFLHLLPDENPAKKYAHFLSHFLRIYLDRPDKINSRSSKQIYRALEELRQQAKDLITVKNYIESYGIFINLMLYNSLLIEKTSPDTPVEFDEFQRDFMESFSLMLEMDVPRPLLLELEEDMRNLLLSGSIFLLDPRSNALDLLLKRADSDDRRLSLLVEYTAYLQHKALKPEILKNSWVALIHQSLKYGYKDHLIHLISLEKLRGKTVYRLIFDYMDEDQIIFSEMLIEASLAHYGNKLEHYFLEPRLLIGLKYGYPEKARACMLKVVKSPFQDYKTLRKLLRQIPEDERDLFIQITAELIPDQKISPATLRVYATFLTWVNELEQTFELIRDYGNIWIMIEFSSLLQGNLKEVLVNYYSEYINQYLESHIGKMSIEHIRKILSGLRDNGAYAIADSLEKNLRSNFSHRKSVSKYGRDL